VVQTPSSARDPLVALEADRISAASRPGRRPH